MARSTSSMMLGEEPRTTMVATWEPSSPSCSMMVHIVEPISRTCTCEHEPMSSGVGGSIRTSVLAPVVRQIRRSSNLDGHFITMILCFSQKWSASSPTAWPQTIMLTPVSRRLEQDSPLSFSSCGVERDAVHCNLGIDHLLDCAERPPWHAHATHNGCCLDRRTQNFGDADIVLVELGDVLGHRQHARLGNPLRKERFVAPLLGCDDRVDGGREFLHVVKRIGGRGERDH
eukprot:scaffold255490_cov33-Tisochrysis_lutea.AAC.2